MGIPRQMSFHVFQHYDMKTYRLNPPKTQLPPRVLFFRFITDQVSKYIKKYGDWNPKSAQGAQIEKEMQTERQNWVQKHAK